MSIPEIKMEMGQEICHIEGMKEVGKKLRKSSCGTKEIDAEAQLSDDPYKGDTSQEEDKL